MGTLGPPKPAVRGWHAGRVPLMDSNPAPCSPWDAASRAKATACEAAIRAAEPREG